MVFNVLFLDLMAFPHTYKFQAKTFLHFSFLATAILIQLRIREKEISLSSVEKFIASKMGWGHFEGNHNVGQKNSAGRPLSVFNIYIYGRTRLNGYLTKKLRIFALLYVHIVDYSTTFEVF